MKMSKPTWFVTYFTKFLSIKKAENTFSSTFFGKTGKCTCLVRAFWVTMNTGLFMDEHHMRVHNRSFQSLTYQMISGWRWRWNLWQSSREDQGLCDPALSALFFMPQLIQQRQVWWLCPAGVYDYYTNINTTTVVCATHTNAERSFCNSSAHSFDYYYFILRVLWPSFPEPSSTDWTSCHEVQRRSAWDYTHLRHLRVVLC